MTDRYSQYGIGSNGERVIETNSAFFNGGLIHAMPALPSRAESNKRRNGLSRIYKLQLGVLVCFDQ
jgi:hypothetical protein